MGVQASRSYANEGSPILMGGTHLQHSRLLSVVSGLAGQVFLGAENSAKQVIGFEENS